MSIPEACIEAETVEFESGDEGPEARARRVILALAENMPHDALLEAWAAYQKANPFMTKSDHGDALQAAIADFLKHVAGETP